MAGEIGQFSDRNRTSYFFKGKNRARVILSVESRLKFAYAEAVFNASLLASRSHQAKCTSYFSMGKNGAREFDHDAGKRR